MIDAADFARLFRAATRVRLDWERLLRERWPVGVELVDEVGEWYTPWYVDPEGEPASWEAPSARQLRVSEWRASRPPHLEKVEAIAAELRRDRGRPPLVLAAYALPGGGRLILDGNHRAAATTAVTDPPPIVAFVVAGPIDSDALADLASWEAAAD